MSLEGRNGTCARQYANKMNFSPSAYNLNIYLLFSTHTHTHTHIYIHTEYHKYYKLYVNTINSLFLSIYIIHI